MSIFGSIDYAPTFAWHVHHNVLIEPLIDSIESRRAYIKTHKHSCEQELRLRLLQPVPTEALPRDLLLAWSVLRATTAKTLAEIVRPISVSVYSMAYNQACLDYLHVLRGAEMSALHARLCPDCPWDGQSIFPETKE